MMSPKKQTQWREFGQDSSVVPESKMNTKIMHTPGCGRQRGASIGNLSKMRRQRTGTSTSALEGITKNDIRRLARRGGVKRMSNEIPVTAKGALKDFVRDTVEKACVYAEHAGRRTVTPKDIIMSLKLQGITVYGYDAVGLMPPVPGPRLPRAQRMELVRAPLQPQQNLHLKDSNDDISKGTLAPEMTAEREKYIQVEISHALREDCEKNKLLYIMNASGSKEPSVTMQELNQVLTRLHQENRVMLHEDMVYL
mmetsp:Transcript_39868/g.74805  ORF Transcript_39868/g.74805 Transcript_39868/m.74805 type:complete len:253 (-) Transcript_39868:484-1242(-)